MDQWDIKISTEELDAFVRRHGKISLQTLSVLGKHHDFHEAVTSPIGKELTKDLMERMDRLALKIVDGTVTEDERVENKVCREIFAQWIRRIRIYLVHAKKIRE